jgi:hypothetical protein
MDTLETALDMARRGFRLFPLQSGGKLPLWGEWQNTATNDPEAIRGFLADPLFGQWNGNNYGVLTTGFAVVDIDRKNGVDGMSTAIEIGAVVPSLMVTTPTGGTHVYFSAGEDVSNSASKLGPGLDIRGRGGYVVGPGSLIDGKAYEIASDAPLAQLPANIASQCRAMALPAAVSRQAVGLTPEQYAGAMEAARAMLVEAPGRVDGDGRNDATYKLATAVRDLGLDEHDCVVLMAEHLNPRHVPPYDGEKLQAVVSHGYRYAKGTQGAASPAAQFPALVVPADAIAPAAVCPFVEFDLDDQESLDRRDWIADKFLLRKYTTALVAAPSVGKSSLTIAWALALAAGRGDFIGLDISRPYRVLLVNNEDDTDEQRRRIFAGMNAHGIDKEALQGRLFHYTVGNAVKPFLAVQRDATRGLAATDDVKTLAQFAISNSIDVIVFDPLAEMHAGDENSNPEMAAVAGIFREVARVTNSAVLLVHHTRKPSANDTAGDMSTARGASSLLGSTRLAYTLAGMSKDDAKAYGVEEDQRGRYVRLDRAKGNFIPADSVPTWLEHLSVMLGNGETANALKLKVGLERTEAVNNGAIGPGESEAIIGMAGLEPITVNAAAKSLLADGRFCKRADGKAYSWQTVARHIQGVFGTRPVPLPGGKIITLQQGDSGGRLVIT